ncbi:hypothetical protein Pyrfu_1809 [Pyrolobus fumarii 1A]|uniref:Biotin/lipoate A/B protein ligase n=1 Tax=Pyrolobus fumarii (strain DSM 11204 / 1A) TaxID=694429 RepID=G0ECU3_PYRF1|nr:hypothetical protein Pyrfu_1809 [Pyrolobus fumarii 1A]
MLLVTITVETNLPQPTLHVLRAPRGFGEVLAAAESIIGATLKSRGFNILVSSWPHEGVTLGLYEPCNVEYPARRLTGGARIETTKDYAYILVANGSRDSSLREAVKLARDLLECMGFGVKGPMVTGGHVAYGVTSIEGVAIVEIIGDFDLSMAVKCMGARLDGSARSVKVSPELATSFESENWTCYRGVEGLPHVTVYGRDGFYARLGFELHDNFVSRAEIDGVFFAAPPMEPYSVLASIRGVQVDELALHTLVLALEKRLDVYGVDKSELAKAAASLAERLARESRT